MYTQYTQQANGNIYLHNAYIRIHMASCIDQGRQKAQHSFKHSTKGLILLPSLADQAEGPLLGNIYTRMFSVDDSSSWAQSLQQAAQKLTQSPQLLAPGHMSP